MRPTGAVHLLASANGPLRTVLDSIDERLASFGLAPDERIITSLDPAAVKERADTPANADGTGTAITPELVAAAGVAEATDPIAYARLTGPTVLSRVVREEAPGHERVPLQCDERSGGLVTGYTVYRYDSQRGEYVTYATADSVFDV